MAEYDVIQGLSDILHEYLRISDAVRSFKSVFTVFHPALSESESPVEGDNSWCSTTRLFFNNSPKIG